MPPLVLGPVVDGASASHLAGRTVAGAPTHRGKGSEAGSGPGLTGPSATASLLCWAIAPILRVAEDVFELRCDRPRASWLHRDDLCEQKRAEALVRVGAYLPLADVCSGVVWSFHPHRHLHGLTRFGRRHRRGL